MKSGWLSIMVRGAHPTLTLNFELFKLGDGKTRHFHADKL